LLQDRFTELARTSDGATPPSATNPQRGERLRSRLDLDLDLDLSGDLALVVEALDRAAFDPSWRDTGPTTDYEQVATALDALERKGRRRTRRLTCS
jgi:hypothetical protein